MTKKYSIVTMLVILVSLFCSLAQANFVVQNQLEVSVTTASTSFLAQNTSRHYLLIINNGTNSVVLKFGSAQSGNEGILIPSGGNYEPAYIPVDELFMKSASGTQTVTIIEG